MDVFEGLDPKVRERTKKMLMYFILFAVVMLFAGFTSAYIVSNVGQYWVHIEALAPSVDQQCPHRGQFPADVAEPPRHEGRPNDDQLRPPRPDLRPRRRVHRDPARRLERAPGKGHGLDGRRDRQRSGSLPLEQHPEPPRRSAQWGVDYTVTQDGVPLNYRPETNQLFASDDVLLARDITLDVERVSNSAGYLFILILIHLFHLALGLAYVLVNGIRILTGRIHPGDTVRLHTGGVYWHFLGLLRVVPVRFPVPRPLRMA